MGQRVVVGAAAFLVCSILVTLPLVQCVCPVNYQIFNGTLNATSSLLFGGLQEADCLQEDGQTCAQREGGFW